MRCATPGDRLPASALHETIPGMVDTNAIIAEHPELVERIGNGDGNALRELMDIVAATDAEERRPPAER